MTTDTTVGPVGEALMEAVQMGHDLWPETKTDRYTGYHCHRCERAVLALSDGSAGGTATLYWCDEDLTDWRKLGYAS